MDIIWVYPKGTNQMLYLVRFTSEDLNLWLWANDIDILSYLGNRSVLRCVHPVSFWIIICGEGTAAPGMA